MMTDEELARLARVLARRKRGSPVIRLFRRFDAWFIELPASLIVLSAFATGLALAAILAWLGH